MGYLEQRLGLAICCIFAFLLAACNSCSRDYAPKPRGYFRITLPVKEYQQYKSLCPYTFSYPVYARIEPDNARGAKPCWINLSFPSFNGKLHLSYYPVQSETQFNELIEDSRMLAFKHTVKATGIDEAYISYPERKVYGTYYTIGGNTASSVQFFLTDSNKHYLRAALYFDEVPRVDSLQPVLDFVKQDLQVFIKSFRWQ